ncbi:MAG TPA: EboA domain-containing protein [Pseudonocardiaceae bacterium]|nr:EboA domain-containing protein [Pseudonocardiaceae bacterium]
MDDGVRALLLVALPTDLVVGELTHLYQHGDAAERRAVLRALPLLPIGAAAVPLVQDALRTNDSRLISGALGPYGATYLDDHSYRHAVLKCVFTGIPLGDVAGLPARADRELARMLADYARELIAAGRDVPPDIQPLIDAYPEVGAP